MSKRLSQILLLLLSAGTLAFALAKQPLSQLLAALRQARPWPLAAGLGLMLLYVGLEAVNTHGVLTALGRRPPLAHCLRYAFTGFYFSSITPSASGGQPAQMLAMKRDGVTLAHSSVNFLVLGAAYQLDLLLYGAAALPLCLGALRAAPGLRALLLLGALANLCMVCAMALGLFLPRLARRLALGAARILAKLRLLRDREAALRAVDKEMAAFAAAAGYIRSHPLVTLRVMLVTFVQLTALFLVPYMVYKAFGLAGQAVWRVVALQALVTIAVSSLPLPGAAGAAEGAFLQAFRLLFADLLLPAMALSRLISFYAMLLVSYVVTSLGARRTPLRPALDGSQALAPPPSGNA